jgi:hypothetical protein
MSYTWALLPLVDGFMGMLTVPGMTKDTTGSIPQQFHPDTLYAGPVSQEPRPIDTGASDEIVFRFRLVYSVAMTGEDGGKVRKRPVSDAQDAGIVIVGLAVEANRTAANLWDWLQIDRVTYDGFAQFDCRGLYIELSGYRIIPS